jgi:hypothetical protein
LGTVLAVVSTVATGDGGWGGVIDGAAAISISVLVVVGGCIVGAVVLALANVGVARIVSPRGCLPMSLISSRRASGSSVCPLEVWVVGGA